MRNGGRLTGFGAATDSFGSRSRVGTEAQLNTIEEIANETSMTHRSRTIALRFCSADLPYNGYAALWQIRLGEVVRIAEGGSLSEMPDASSF